MLHLRHTIAGHSQSPGATSLRGRRHGVTLLEMMIVLVMVGILSSIAASRLDYTKYRADSVARGVLTDLANAQRLAVSLQANVRVTIPDSSRMVIHEDIDNNGSAGGSERVRSLPLEYKFAFSKGTAGDTPSPSDPATLSLVVFNRDGSANRGGTFYLAGPGSDAGCRHCRAIVVTRATGRVVLYSYATGSWKRAN